LVKSSPTQLGLGFSGLAVTFSFAKSKKYWAIRFASSLLVRLILVKSSEYSFWPLSASRFMIIRSIHSFW